MGSTSGETPCRGALGRRGFLRSLVVPPYLWVTAFLLAELKGDADARYEHVVRVLGMLMKMGITDVNMIADPNRSELHVNLGSIRSLQGNTAEAEAAFRLVTGPRAELAGFWLAWLAGRPAA